MKKIKLFFVSIVMSLSLLSQNNSEIQDWWLPSAFGTCRDSLIYTGANPLSIELLGMHHIWVYDYATQNSDTITDLEQRYTVDSTVRIAGVGVSGGYLDNYSFRIRDFSTDTVIASMFQPIVADTIIYEFGSTKSLFEYMFDSIVTINDDFLISVWYPEISEESRQWYRSSCGMIFGYYFITDDNRSFYEACNSGEMARCRLKDGSRIPALSIYDIPSNHATPTGESFGTWLERLGINGRYLCDIGVFPIFAEEETNGGSGETGDSDSTSALPSVEVEKYMSVFPNPASETLNVGCSYKIQSYAVLNSLGQELISEKANANTLNINLAGLKSGVYFIKIHTSKGTATKRFVVQ